jgi:hypothetical protein
LRLVTGSETGIDWAVPFVHYFEGMMSLGPYRLPDSGYDLFSYKKPDEGFLKFQIGTGYRIPLFELVYHDAVVSYWYWGDASNRLPEAWDARDLLNALYATPPLWSFDRDGWNKSRDRFVQSYRNGTQTAREAGYLEMLSHEFLSPSHDLQRTTFAGGYSVIVNFGSQSVKLPDGSELGARSFKVTNRPSLPGKSGKH